MDRALFPEGKDYQSEEHSDQYFPQEEINKDKNDLVKHFKQLYQGSLKRINFLTDRMNELRTQNEQITIIQQENIDLLNKVTSKNRALKLVTIKAKKGLEAHRQLINETLHYVPRAGQYPDKYDEFLQKLDLIPQYLDRYQQLTDFQIENEY